MTNRFEKAGRTARIATVSPIIQEMGSDRTLRGAIASQIDLLIEILDRMDGDWDIEPDMVESEGLEEEWTQPASLGPSPRTVRRGSSRTRASGAAERDQADFHHQFDEIGQALQDQFSAAQRPRTGLRASVRDRLVRHGTDVPTDAELLGALLSLVTPRRDVESPANLLINRFGSFSSALAAPVAQLAVVEGLGRTSATNLKIILAAAKRFGRDRSREANSELVDPTP